METIGQATAAVLNSKTTTAESPTNSEWRPSLELWHKDVERAADACARFIADMEAGHEPYWLTFAGRPGAGKTMLARQVFEFAAQNINPGRHAVWLGGTGIYSADNRRPNCVWFTATKFKDRMLGGEYDLPEYLRTDFLVVIDDLGAARDTRENALADGLYRLADQRAHRWMIWTTNLTLPEIAERLDPRISSRLVRDENKVVTLKCGDYALHRAA